ncbi:MAG TPA: hypothetical protein VM580_02710, partial [Labilithrix sp.]|nr:hypothetical protein [Labilithrix sp.]
MEARVVGGCAAWFVGSALFSCGVGPSRSSVVEPTVGPTEVVPWTPAISASPSAGLLPEPVSAVDDAEPVPASSRVVFVTLDGVRWQDVLVGAGDTSDGTMMPN